MITDTSMMRFKSIILVALLLSGCGGNFGEEKAVKSLSLGEIIATQRVQINSNRACYELCPGRGGPEIT